MLELQEAKSALQLRADLEAARQLAAEAKAGSTLRVYAGAWKRFVAYAEAQQESPWESPALVAAYLAHLVGSQKRWATVEQARTAISHYHRAKGYLESPANHPQVRLTLQGAKRRLGQQHQGKEPVRIPDLLQLDQLHRHDLSARWVRDRAVLLLGFASALRRENLANVRIEDLAFEPRGLTVFVPKSKTDQAGKGRYIAILRRPKLCPVRAVEAWLQLLGQPSEGPLFRRISTSGSVGSEALAGEAVNEIVKQAMRGLGYDARAYGAHSLRSGFATAAAEANKPLPDILRQGGWKDTRTALTYIRRAQLFEANASDVLP